MSDNIINFPGSGVEEGPAFEEVVQRAKKVLDDGMILGWTEEGTLYIATSVLDPAEMNWLLDKAKSLLLAVSLTDDT